MFEFFSFEAFAGFLLDRQDQTEKAARIMQGILEARSPRLSDISHRMPGNPAASCEAIQCIMEQADPKAALQRLFQEDASFFVPSQRPGRGGRNVETPAGNWKPLLL